jgi:hypothetical protein
MALVGKPDTFYHLDFSSHITSSLTERYIQTGYFTKTTTSGMITYVRVSFRASLQSSGLPGSGAELIIYVNGTAIMTVNIGSSGSYTQVQSINSYADGVYDYDIKYKVNTSGDRITINQLMVQTYKT